MSVSMYKIWLEETSLSRNTINAYLNDLKHFEKWFKETNGEELAPEKVTRLDTQDYFSYLNRKYQPRTVNRRMAAVRHYLKKAIENNYIDSMPSFSGPVRFQRYAPKHMDRLQQKALERIVRASGNKRDIAIIVFVLETGLRVSEVVNIKYEDLVLRERSGEVKVYGKGAKDRIVPLSAEARKVLRAYFEKHPPLKGEYIFRGQRGPLGSRALEKIIQKYLYQAKLTEEGFSFHSLRHTFAKRLVDRGESLEKIAALLGHENLNYVMVYTYPTLEDLRKVVEK